MATLWGLDCQNPRCVHDSVRALRLRFFVKPTTQCTGCGHGEAVPVERMVAQLGLDPDDSAEWEEATDWWRCPRATPCEPPWRHRWQPERTDMVFRDFQREAAFAQMELLGVTSPSLGAHYSTPNHASLPPGFELRMLRLTEEPMPRTALYLKWRPDQGEILTPDHAVQGVFTPDMTAAQRAQASVRHLTDSELRDLLRIEDRFGRESQVYRMSRVRCQHCQSYLPLRTFNTLTLREVDWGD